MLEEMQSVALLGLLVCQYYLIRGCFRINETIPVTGGSISGKIDRTADLLDEMAQLISDFADGFAGGGQPVAQTPTGFGDLLTAFLNNRMNMGVDHATTEQQWEIHEEEINPTTTQEYQPNDGGPAVPNR